MRNLFRSTLTLAAMLLLSQTAISQTRESDSAFRARILGDSVQIARGGDMTPSQWIAQNKALLIRTESRALAGFDTSFMAIEYPRLLSTFTLTERDFTANKDALRLRYMKDIRAKLIQIRDQVEAWAKRITTVNAEIMDAHLSLKEIQNDSLMRMNNIDDRVWRAYRPEFDSIQRWTAKVDQAMSDRMEGYVNIENRLNSLSFLAAETLVRVNSAIREEESSYFTPQHPPIWKVNGSTYPEGLGHVFMKTLRVSLDALAFYGKHAYIRAILFRIFILCITLLPVWYFKRINKEKKGPSDTLQHRFLHKHTAKAASTFGLVLAPFIFVNSPMIFTEVILVTLAITTSMIFLAEHPEVNKRAYLSILCTFILLKLFHLFTEVTMAGRLLTTASIVLLIPFWTLIKGIPKIGFRKKVLPWLVTWVTVALLILGWGLTIFGLYRLGRSLIIASLTSFFFAVVLHIGVYALVDFVMILSDLYNRRDSVSKIRIENVYDKLVRLFTIPAFLFWIWALFLNTNSVDFLSDQLESMASYTISFGDFSLRMGSALIFMTCLVIAFYIAGLLQGLFYEEHRDDALSTDKTSVGSYVILFRLLIIGAGFIVGMIAAGIPLSNINLIIGALGVGIGFGLQNIVGNLVSGVILAFEKPIYVGDVIEMDGIKGKVSEIGIRATTLDIAEGSQYIIPNAELISKNMKNWTLASKAIRVETQVSTAISNDPEKVLVLLRESVTGSKTTSRTRPPKISLREIKAQSMIFGLQFWVDDIQASDAARTEVLKTVHAAFAQEGITYPKPEKNDD